MDGNSLDIAADKLQQLFSEQKIMKRLIPLLSLLTVFLAGCEETYTTRINNLHFRSSPSLEADVIRKLPFGAEVKAVGEETGWTQEIELGDLAQRFDEPWVKVVYMGQEGWVYRGGLSSSGPAIGPATGQRAEANNRNALHYEEGYTDSRANGPIEISELVGFWNVEMEVVTSDCEGVSKGDKMVERWTVNNQSETDFTIKVSERDTRLKRYEGDWDNGAFVAIANVSRWSNQIGTVRIAAEYIRPGYFRGTRRVIHTKSGCIVEYNISIRKG